LDYIEDYLIKATQKYPLIKEVYQRKFGKKFWGEMKGLMISEA
jgi:hypothetical protein